MEGPRARASQVIVLPTEVPMVAPVVVVPVVPGSGPRTGPRVRTASAPATATRVALTATRAVQIVRDAAAVRSAGRAPRRADVGRAAPTVPVAMPVDAGTARALGRRVSSVSVVAGLRVSSVSAAPVPALRRMTGMAPRTGAARRRVLASPMT